MGLQDMEPHQCCNYSYLCMWNQKSSTCQLNEHIYKANTDMIGQRNDALYLTFFFFFSLWKLGFIYMPINFLLGDEDLS